MFSLEETFDSILSDSMFMEEATFSVYETSYTIKGFFSSGTFSYESNVAYAPKDLVPEEHFVASLSEFDGIEKPFETLKGINNFTVADRGTFRIKNVSGERSGVINLLLDKVRKYS